MGGARRRRLREAVGCVQPDLQRPGRRRRLASSTPRPTAPTSSSSPTARWSPPTPARSTSTTPASAAASRCRRRRSPASATPARRCRPNPKTRPRARCARKPSGNLPPPPMKKPLKCKKNKVKRFGKCVTEEDAPEDGGSHDEGARCARVRISLVARRAGDRRRSGCARPPPRPTSASSPATKASTSPRPPKAARQPATLAGSHPYSLITEINFNKAGEFSDGDLRNLQLDLPPGLIENPTAVPRCSPAQFATPRDLALRSEPLGRELPGRRPRSAS